TKQAADMRGPTIRETRMVKPNLELRSIPPVLAAAACTLLLLSPLLATGEEATFEVALSGPEASGDPDGQGEATVVLDSETNTVDVRLRYSNIAPPTALFIRMGATGMEGNIALPITIESD